MDSALSIIISPCWEQTLLAGKVASCCMKVVESVTRRGLLLQATLPVHFKSAGLLPPFIPSVCVFMRALAQAPSGLNYILPCQRRAEEAQADLSSPVAQEQLLQQQQQSQQQHQPGHDRHADA